MWSFKEWLYEYRSPKYTDASKQVLAIIKDSVEKIPPEALTVKDLKAIYAEHGLGTKVYETIPFIMSARTGDLSYMRMLPKDSDDAILDVVMKWWPTLRKSKHSFPNTFVLAKALEAIDRKEAGDLYRKHVLNTDVLDKKWPFALNPA